MQRQEFFTTSTGEKAHRYFLHDGNRLAMEISDWGGTVLRLLVPDREGRMRDVALGWKNPADYEKNSCFFGALVGRVPNRIGGGRFTMDGTTYQMVLNDANHSTLHGGFSYAARLWQVESATGTSLELRLTSPDGDAGFPGKVEFRARYSLENGNALRMEFSAEADRPAVADLTNHTYFNLNGENGGKCDDHTIAIAAKAHTEVDPYLVPTGRSLSVENTPWDLRQGKSFREILQNFPKGFDDNFILGDSDRLFRENAIVVSAENSGIRMRIDTNRPGVQFYMGGYLENLPGKSGPYSPNSGFCLETQAWPDAVNHPAFPSIRIAPGTPFHGVTVLHFDTI